MESANLNGIRKQNAAFTFTLQIPLTVCGFRLKLPIPQQLNVTIHMSYFLFVDFTNFSGFRPNSCKFRKFACFWSNFERYNVSSIRLWKPKQQRRSEKSRNIAVFSRNLSLVCCGIRLQCTKRTVWPRNAKLKTWIENVWYVFSKVAPENRSFRERTRKFREQ